MNETTTIEVLDTKTGNVHTYSTKTPSEIDAIVVVCNDFDLAWRVIDDSENN